MDVSFYRSWQAFPHSRDRDDDLVVSVYPDGLDAGGNYEFSMVHVGTKGSRQPIALRVQLFADSWRAFADLPEFFALLASLDESDCSGRSQLDLNDLTPSLEALGWRDDTEKYATRHAHVMGCLTCGARQAVASEGI